MYARGHGENLRVAAVNERQRALELLAGNPAGYTEAALLERHGLSLALLGQLQRSGLVSASPEVMRFGRRTQRVTRIVIPDAGKRALASFIHH
jgi:hypothetical protein